MRPIFVSSPPTKSLANTTLMGVQPLAKDIFFGSIVTMTGLSYYGITGLESTYQKATWSAAYICQ